MKIQLVVLLLAGLVFTSCLTQDASIENLTSTGEGTTADTDTTDVYSVVSYGEGQIFNEQTGSNSDLKIHPTSRLPAVAYYDKSLPASGTTTVGALKYAYMSSDGNWNIEVVDQNYGTTACGTAASNCIGAPNAAAPISAQIIALAFKSTGLPVIAYVYGQSLTGTVKSVRFAERSSTGAWTISTAITPAPTGGIAVATIEPIKAINLVLDSANRPHITGYAIGTTQTNSLLFYAMRPTGSTTWTTSNVTVTAAPGTFNGPVSLAATIAAGQFANQRGMAICPVDGQIVMTAFLNDTAAAGGGEPWLLRCSTVSAAGACTAWQGLSLASGCAGTGCFAGMTGAGTNSGQRSDLVIDPVTNKMIVGYYSTATPATTLTTAIVGGAGEDCSTSLASMSTAADYSGLNHPTATAGQNGFRLYATASNTFLAHLLGTTAVNLTKANASLGSAWLVANQVTVDTTTVAGETVGFAYDSTYDLLHLSYARIPAGAMGAAGNDIVYGQGMPSDVTSTGFFPTSVIDETMRVFPSLTPPVHDMERAPDGTVGFAYFYTETGGTAPDPGESSKLYYGFKGGTSTAPTFAKNVVAKFVQGNTATYVGQYPSLTYDSNSNPIISYLDAASSTGRLYVSRSKDKGVSFTTDWIDGSTAANTVGQYSSVKTSSSTIGVAYYDFLAANRRLKFAKKISATSPWIKYVVNGLTGGACAVGTTTDAGKFAKLQFTSDGRPAIAYQATESGVTVLKIAYATEALTSTTYTWSCLTLDTSGVNNRGEGIDFYLDSEDIPHIVHYDTSTPQIRYVTCADAIGTCISSASNFTSERVTLVTGVVTNSSRAGVRKNSDDTVYVSYYTTADNSVVISSKAAGASTWTAKVIDQPDDSGGTYTPAGGQYADLELNASGYPMMMYRSIENWLKFYSEE